MRYLSKLPYCLMLAAILAIAGCNSHTDKVRDILDNPVGYANHDVTVAGEVTHVLEVPGGIINTAAYEVNDSTGQVWVVSQAGAPREGDKVGLKGSVKQEFQLAGTTLGTVIMEKNRRIK